jgi:rubrerythrin
MASRSHIDAWFKEESINSGLYFAMARRAEEEGDPEIAASLRHIAEEKIDNAAVLAELAGKIGDTKDNLAAMLESEDETAKTLRAEAKNATEEENMEFLKIADDKDRHAGALRGILSRFE